MPDYQTDERDGIVGGEQLDDGVIWQNGESWMTFKLPKGVKPKARQLKLVDEKRGIYAVPKSDVFAYTKVKLADGSTVTILRYKAIPRTERQAAFDAGVAKGLKVQALETERADREGPPRKVSFDSLK